MSTLEGKLFDLFMYICFSLVYYNKNVRVIVLVVIDNVLESNGTDNILRTFMISNSLLSIYFFSEILREKYHTPTPELSVPRETYFCICNRLKRNFFHSCFSIKKNVLSLIWQFCHIITWTLILIKYRYKKGRAS